MEPVELKEIMYVLAVCEEKSFSRAAEKHYISQPGLSKIVKRTEQKLGVKLFVRGSAPLSLTPEGENIIALFQRMYGIQAELEQYCRNAHRKRRSELSVAAPSFFCTYVLPPIVTAFKMEHPDCDVKLIEVNDKDLKGFLRAGIADVGLSVEGNAGDEFDALLLKREHIILAVPRRYAVNERVRESALSYEDLCGGRLWEDSVPAVSMEHFSGERFLFLKQGNDMYERGLRICQAAGFQPNVVMSLDQLLTAYYLAEAGEGVTLIRAGIPYYTGYSDGLLFYKIDHPDTSREVWLYQVRGKKRTEMERGFIDCLKNSPLPG